MAEDILAKEILDGKYSHHTEMDFSNRNLHYLPSEIGLLRHATKINFANNPLSELCDEFAELSNLRILFFLNCEFKKVPKILTKLESLFMLSFKGNLLESVSKDELPLSLYWLILTNNLLKKVDLEGMHHIQKLMLANNNISEINLSGCSNLELVRLSSNQLSSYVIPESKKLAWFGFGGNLTSQPHFSKTQFDFSAITLGKLLGEGASGKVFEGSLHGSSSTVAVKIFTSISSSDGACMNEINVSEFLSAYPIKDKHRVLLNVVGSFESPHLGLVMEMCEGKVLGNPPNFQSISRDTYDASKLQHGSFSASLITTILSQLASALCYLHTPQIESFAISHGDVYSHNLLLVSSSPVRIKLVDFGAASIYDKQQVGDQLEKVEVLAFGILAAELLAHYLIVEQAPSKLIELITQCRDEDCFKRPSFSELENALNEMI
jgi:Protein kinase domain